MNQIDTISFAHVGEGIDIERVDAELKALLLTAEGTIPGCRSFGLTGEFLSRQRAEAVNLLGMELEEKVETFIPEISIANVEDTSEDLASRSTWKGGTEYDTRTGKLARSEFHRQHHTG